MVGVVDEGGELVAGQVSEVDKGGCHWKRRDLGEGLVDTKMDSCETGKEMDFIYKDCSLDFGVNS